MKDGKYANYFVKADIDANYFVMDGMDASYFVKDGMDVVVMTCCVQKQCIACKLT